MEALVAASSGAIAGLITGVIGSLIAPWVQWAIETRRNRQNYRRELIQTWRRVIDEGIIIDDAGFNEIYEFTHTPEYSLMKRYLSAELRGWMEAEVSERKQYLKENNVLEYQA
jgi:hypothetical protein